MCIKLNACCCGCSLQSGTKVIGFLSMVGIFNGFIFVAIAWNYFSIEGNVLSLCAAITSIIIGIISIVSTISLLISAFKNSDRHLLLPWIVFGVVGMIIGSTATFYTAILLVLFGLPGMSVAIGTPLALVVGGFISTALGAYFWIVVYSYHRELKEREDYEMDQTK